MEQDTPRGENERYRLYDDPLLRELSGDTALQSQLDGLAMADKRYGDDPANTTLETVRNEAEVGVRRWIAGKGYATSEPKPEDSSDEN